MTFVPYFETYVATPTKGDLDRNLSSILHEAHQKARAEKARLTSEFAARGLVSSGALISSVAGLLDGIHKEALEPANPMLRDFADRMQITPSQIALIARPHLQNMGNSVLGERPRQDFRRFIRQCAANIKRSSTSAQKERCVISRSDSALVEAKFFRRSRIPRK